MPENLSPSGAAAASPQPDPASSNHSAPKEWYVLVGISGKCLKTTEVKQLYEAKKVRIRGPYSWEEIARYHSSGMIKDDFMLYKKGDLEWIPYERHVADQQLAAEAAAEPDEEIKEWYILAGLAGKTLETQYIKEMYDKGQVKIRGPYTKAQVLKFFHDDLINNETMLYRKGDRDWKPLSRHEIGSFQQAVKAIIFQETGEEISSRNAVVRNIAQALLNHKKLFAAGVIAAAGGAIAWPYYYYSPSKIYERITKSVVMVTCVDAEKKEISLGSGFVVGDGLVATNLHVIDKASRVNIKSGDNVTYGVEGVVKIDPKNDVAVLKIVKQKYELAKLEQGDPDELSIGDRIYTIGNPGGLEFSLSEGLVSGKRKEDPRDKKARDLIQITAPISPGNSGGPVLDKKGRVIGIATLGSRNEYQNLNFAVPVTLAGKPEEYKEMVLRFLPSNPRWKSFGIKQLTETGYGIPGQYRLDSMDAYYDQDSVARFSENRMRLWLKVILHYQQSYQTSYQNGYYMYGYYQNGYYNTATRPQTITAYSLSEVDCKNNRYRYNVAYASDGKDQSPVTSNFEDDKKWESMTEGDKPVFDEICK